MPVKKESQEAQLERRAAEHGYTLEKKSGEQWHAEIAGTRYGPMQTLDELDEFLPRD